MLRFEIFIICFFTIVFLTVKFSFDTIDSLIRRISKNSYYIFQKENNLIILYFSLDSGTKTNGLIKRNENKINKFLPLLKFIKNEEDIFKYSKNDINKDINIHIKLKNNKRILTLRKLEESILIIIIRGFSVQYLSEQFHSSNKPISVYADEINNNFKEKNYISFNENINHNITVKYGSEQLTSCENMFFGCTNIVSLDLSNFKTSKVSSMKNMFRSCTSLVSIDLSNFNTKNVVNMDSMFYGCNSLSKINVSSFDTESVTNMDNMFSGCRALLSLNLSNFNVSKTGSMNSMFFDCSELQEIDLSNFDTSNLIEGQYSFLFASCSNLVYINLLHFKGKDIFSSLSNLNKLKVCINTYDQITGESSTLKNSQVSIKCKINVFIKLRINFCLPVEGLELGIFVENEIINLETSDKCLWTVDIEKDNFNDLKYKIIILKNSTIVRIENNFNNFILDDMLNNGENNNYNGCSYKAEKIDDCSSNLLLECDYN